MLWYYYVTWLSCIHVVSTSNTEIIERTDEDDCALNHHSEGNVDKPDFDHGQNLVCMHDAY